jgi:hypothetical protein
MSWAGEMWVPSVTVVLSKVRSWSMNWPRYVKPAGICPAAEPRPTIALAIRRLFGAPSWRFTPRGPILEKRNGGAVTPAVLATTGESRPSMLSPSRPSPMTK